ncbi:MaoC family dehydratase [Aquabacterium sp. J223]|uniref:MaoC family dehydratase n=1 Tax=Aquabacterium sp. J223 TaxID=2898431 RepID=UPI0021ADA0AA|nr:MaoC family dehydratase [Aquabacterium sp. J223]UUX97103.1 3-alpha,7-alpha,12-alpha-trihydroxy-5-beta-cholest-24-enoyl-CoA hydratase [Aquabacterium sp. J223]
MPHIRDLPQREFPAIEQRYDERDTLLYGLGLGLGQDPTDPGQLRHVYEEGLAALPTQAAVLASPGFWMQEPDTGIQWQHLVAAGHEVELTAPLPVRGHVVSRARVTQVFDRGAGKGALILWERALTEVPGGRVLAHIRCSAIARADGGFGGPTAPRPAGPAMPERPADHRLDWQTLPGQALLYRLTGDMNPLHASPAVARSAGFERPILHGLCTLGIAAYLLGRHCAGPQGLQRIGARYTGVVYPGDLLRTEVWKDGDALAFRVVCVDRDKVVLDGGTALPFRGDAA